MGRLQPKTSSHNSFTEVSTSLPDPPAEYTIVFTDLPPSTDPLSEVTVPEVIADPAPGECWNPNQVALHSTDDDCYYILYGQVFDFTDYVEEHPGGPEVMLTECGTDATAIYETAKKHDISLLEKKGGYDYLIGEQCPKPIVAADGTINPPCLGLEDIALHDTVEDCYYILYNHVFDFTNYIDRHPGGDEIMITECGTNATEIYETAKKHDYSLLESKGGFDYLIAEAC